MRALTGSVGEPASIPDLGLVWLGVINLGENTTSVVPSDVSSALAAAMTSRSASTEEGWTGVDVWTGEPVSVKGSITLRPHASKLMQFTRTSH